VIRTGRQHQPGPEGGGLDVRTDLRFGPEVQSLNKANPIAQILAGKLMLEHLGEDRAAELVEQATEDVLEAGKVRTFDIGGKSTCSDMGDAIAERLLKLKP